MIYDMKQIELTVYPLNEARIVPEAVYEPVGVEALAYAILATRESPPHGRTDARHGKEVTIVPLQMIDQHISDQIHAGPILFLKITDDG